MARHRRPTVILFCRQVRYGAGKTRLARAVGRLAAWRFQRSRLAHLARDLTRDPRFRLIHAVTPDRSRTNRRVFPGARTLAGQGRGDLGARMGRLLFDGGRAPVILVGTDIPAMSAGHLVDALTRLAAADHVFGPAADGGFWLIGTRRRCPAGRGWLRHVRWSTGFALADVLGNLPRPHRVAMAATLEDVDDEESFERLVSHR